MPVNDSSTGGPLLPIAGGPAPLEGRALNDFIQGWIAGITGLPGSLVRPRWQAEPPNIPNQGTTWAAVGVTVRPADSFAAVYHNGAGNAGNGQDEEHQHEQLDILASFYGLSSNSDADKYAALLRQGLQISQNLELLTLNGMGLSACGDPTAVPSLFKTRWLYRVDLPVQVNREIVRYYPVLNLLKAQVTIIAANAAGSAITETETVTLP